MPREATEVPRQRSRSPLFPIETTQLASVQSPFVCVPLLSGVYAGSKSVTCCIVCHFTHARTIFFSILLVIGLWTCKQIELPDFSQYLNVV